MRKKVFYKKAEVATLLTLGLVMVGAVMTIVASIFTNNQKNLASKPRANSSDSETRYGSANCTCSQICGGQYIGNSQSVSGGVRQCKCRKNAPANSCPIVYTSFPNTPTDPPSQNLQKCDSNYGTYSDLSMCEIVCGVGSCKRCLLGSTSKWQCNVNTPIQIPACGRKRTYSALVNCKYECNNDCTACSFQGAIRWECGGGGPQELNPTKTPTPQPTEKPPTIRGYICEDVGGCNLCRNMDQQGVCYNSNGVRDDEGKWCCYRVISTPQLTDLCKQYEGKDAYCQLSGYCTSTKKNRDANSYCQQNRNSNYVCCKPSNASATSTPQPIKILPSTNLIIQKNRIRVRVKNNLGYNIYNVYVKIYEQNMDIPHHSIELGEIVHNNYKGRDFDCTKGVQLTISVQFEKSNIYLVVRQIFYSPPVQSNCDEENNGLIIITLENL